MSTPPLDPWSRGSTAYRVTVLLAFGLTFLGVIMVVIHLAGGGSSVPAVPIAVLGAGLLLHLIGTGIRMRDAKRNLQNRKGSAS
ncbi:hypothetical protein [Nesterenkonia aerolata]|uniref:DUF3188 domain-containing protein n=1 Tax=Nesterenkonia aerolata TaxID=3074079 RepID=A0ABU2DTD7_9MICC|nr:hypothetical protein [Nesterenkonia sp. LY-0111]MDR8019768.1 hypothetical protein [Nesterenkonia sp. LY-0111]